MDINDLRSITTVLMLAVFAGVVWWAYSSRHKQAFEEAARLPLADDDSYHPAADERDAAHPDK
jgi:cytochrome c oxidase cbb3-type subunit 4